ncbi:MAG: DEAD/DEAH box helicase [Nanoarchaeota archaeon]
MMLKDFTPRLYQQTILGTAASKNTLVVLPTGLGKTPIAFMLAAQRLSLYPHSKILMLAPTKPLCEQHIETFRKHLGLPEEKIVLFTGSVTPERRAELWKQAQIVISTPQGLENDVINNRVNLKEISLLIFDEAHHATGDYSYVWLAEQYDKVSPSARILALTASPGSDMEKVKEICAHLKIERVEVRTEKDADVRPYFQVIKKQWVEVSFPDEFKKVQKFLRDSRKAKLIEAQKLGYCNSLEMNRSDLLQLQGEMQKNISSGCRDFELLRSVSLIAEALKIEHALELLESQGIKPLQIYFTKLRDEALTSRVRAAKNLMNDACFKSAMYLTEELAARDVLHPKLVKLKEIVLPILQKKPDSKLIVFTQYRNSAEEIVRQLDGCNLKNHIFVGQAKKNDLGFSQKEQKEILDRFRGGGFNILIATSVAEEGLDIPSVDEVIFYEPIPSAIRSIQRRGRTGRLEKGEVIILVTSGTRDEAYRWSAHHKEKRMYRNLEQLKKEFTLSGSFISDSDLHGRENGQERQEIYKNGRQEGLHNFISRNPKNPISGNPIAILADHRESNNRIVKELIEMGLAVKTGQLTSADYVLSGVVGVELKKVSDFVTSIIDGRLLEQIRSLKHSFPKAVLIVEGEEDIYAVRKVHANAIRGMLSSIVLDYQVPVLYTRNPLDTAALLAVMAKREQNKDFDFSYHQSKPHSFAGQQEYIVSSFPNIGVQTSRLLLQSFGSIKKIVNATEEELKSVKGVGDKTAKNLLQMFEGDYEKKNK